MKTILVIGNQQFFAEMQALLSQITNKIEHACTEADVRKKLKRRDIGMLIFDDDSYGSKNRALRNRVVIAMQNSNMDFIFLSSSRKTESVLEAQEFGARDYIVKPYNKREFISRFNAIMHNKTRIACIGGGTGLFNLLMGLKTLPNVLLASIVSTTDDGGSSGRLKESFGVLPPGDIRRSLVALSNAPELMNDVMKYRFKKGGWLKGHNFGNLFLTALAEIKGSMAEAVKDLGDILYIHGIVLPITTNRVDLCALFEDGTVIKGESKIDLGQGRDPRLHIKDIWHEPTPHCNIDAYAALINSEIITIGPGDLFTSIITNLIIKNIREAIVKSRARKVYICNLMTKPGETSGYDVYEHVKKIIKYLGSDCLDYIMMSNTRLSKEGIAKYAKKKQFPVSARDSYKIIELTRAKLVLADVSHEQELVRHDGEKIKGRIAEIITKQ